MFVLSCSNLFDFVFSYLFYHYYSDLCLFSHKREGVDLDGTEGMEDLGRARGWGNCNQK